MKHALITGSGGLLGSALAAEFSTLTNHLSLQFRNREPDLSQLNPSVQVQLLQQDFQAADTDAVAQDLIRAATDAAGLPIDVAVLNAANQSVTPWAQLQVSDWDAMYAETFRATASLLTALGKHMAVGGNSNRAIVVVGSIEGLKPARNHAPYAVMKAALHHLVTAAAYELGETGVRVIGVAPGLIDREGLATDWPTGVAAWEKAAALGRMVTAAEVAKVVSFLASEKASAITGITVPVDAGWNANPGW